MGYQPELTTLAFIVSPDRKQVLLVHRIHRDDDEQLGKYNGLGGKVEPGEDVVSAVQREILEESGLVVTDLELRGTISWPGFNERDVFGFIFLVTSFTGTPATNNEEGTLAWHDISSLPELPMWDGDRHFLPLVFDTTVPQFHGVLPYSGEHNQGASFSYLPANR